MGFRLLRFTNTVILASIAALTLSGVYGLLWTFPGWLYDVHRLSGWLLIAVLPWKAAISMRSLRRGFALNFDRGLMVIVSLLAAFLTLAVAGLGLVWGFQLDSEHLWLRQTAISWHWMLALALVVPFALHAWRRWPRPRKEDLLSRRAALHVIGVGIASLAGWRLSHWIGEQRASAESPTRVTGSRLAGAFTGNRFPVTHTRAARQEQVDPGNWRFEVQGAVLNPRVYTYQQLLSMDAAGTFATLDCTLGWYTIQEWRGLRLRDLLHEAGASPRAFAVRLESVTGYAHILPMAEAKEVLLATHIGEEVLEYAHGFPLRAVAPSRRGWFWVKWLRKVEVIDL